MTAIKPTDSVLRDKIKSDEYNTVLNDINLQYTEMDKFIGNLESDIVSIKDFENSLEVWNYEKLNETDKISRYIKRQFKNYDFS